MNFSAIKPAHTMLKNISLRVFASQIGAGSVQFVKNPKTGKLFASFDNGHKTKCEQAIDFSKGLEVLIEDGDLDSACVINTRETNTVFSTTFA
jgi:hypothetical protein